jgi:hypothetical protein
LRRGITLRGRFERRDAVERPLVRLVGAYAQILEAAGLGALARRRDQPLEQGALVAVICAPKPIDVLGEREEPCLFRAYSIRFTGAERQCPDRQQGAKP